MKDEGKRKFYRNNEMLVSNEKNPIAICVGHSRGDGGAVSAGGMNEWNYNRKVAARVGCILSERGQHAVVVDRYAQASYGTAMRQLSELLRGMGARCAVELHFNSAETNVAQGHEWLYWHTSAAGRAMAQSLERRMAERYPKMARRGIKEITSGAWGGQFLMRTHCPAVIAEPFFGNHPDSWHYFKDHGDELAEVIADGLDDYCGL